MGNRIGIFVILISLLFIQLSGVSSSAQAQEEWIEIVQSAVSPQIVAAGGSVESLVQYKISKYVGTRQVMITETRNLVNGNENIELSTKKIQKPAGLHNSKLTVTLPQDIERGEYSLIVTIASGSTVKKVKSQLMVI